jgi:WD40 repeat protein
MHSTTRKLWGLLAASAAALILPFAFCQEPQLALQTGHSSPVVEIAFSRDDRYMASTSGEGVVIVWDVRSQREIRRWQMFAPGGIAYCHLAFTSRKSLIVSILWGAVEYPIFSDDVPKMLVKDSVMGMALSNDDRWLAFSSTSGALKVADLADAAKIYTIIEAPPPFPPNPLTPRPMPPSRFVFSHDSKMLAAASIAGSISIYKLDPSPSLQSQTNIPFTVLDIAFDATGHLLACGHKQVEPKNEEIQQLRLEVLDVTANTSLVKSVFLVGIARFSSRGNALIVGGGYRIRIVDHVAKGPLLLRVLDSHSGKDLAKAERNINPDDMSALALSPGASRLSFVHGTSHISLWNLKSGTKTQNLGGPIRQVERIEVVRGLNQLAVMTTTDSYVWDLIAGRQSRAIPTSGGFISFSGVSGVATYFNKERQLVFMDAKSGNTTVAPIRSRGDIRDVKMFPNGTTVAWIEDREEQDSQRFVLRIWDLRTRGAPRTLCQPFNPWSAELTVSPSGRYLACECSINTPLPWVPPLNLNEAQMQSSRAAEWRELNDKVRVFDLKTGTSRETRLQPNVQAMAFSAAEESLAAAGQILQVADLRDGTIFDLREGKNTAHAYKALAFTSHGTLIAGMQDEASLQEWTLADKTVRAIEGHQNGTTAIAFSDTGALFTGGIDGSVNLYDLKATTVKASLMSVSSYGWLVVTPEGLFDGTADAMQWVGWKNPSDVAVYPLDMFFNDFYYPGLLTDVLAGGNPKPDGISLVSRLQIPGLKYLLASREASLVRRNGKVGLCLPEQPTADLVQHLAVWEKGDERPVTAGFDKTSDPSCRFFKALPGTLQQYELTASKLSEQVTVAKKTEWDDLPPHLGGGRIHVQAVAIDNYPEKAGLKALSYAVDDARAIEDFFVPNTDVQDHFQCFGAKCIWKRLAEQDATLERIRSRFQDIAKESKEEDIVVLFLSGHGVVPPGQEMFYFLPFDVAGQSRRQQIASGLNSAMLAQAIMEIQARRVLLVIDSCQSGGAMDSLERVVEAKLRIEHRRQSAMAGVDQVGAGLYVIAASTPLQNALEVKGLMHGVLTRAILEILAIQKAPTARSLSEAVPTKTKSITSTLPKKQTPVIVRMGVDFPLGVTRP